MPSESRFACDRSDNFKLIIVIIGIAPSPAAHGRPVLIKLP